MGSPSRRRTLASWNYFCFIGPNSVISNGSLVLGIQATAVYIYKWLDKMQREMVRSFEVRKDVTDEYSQHMQAYLGRRCGRVDVGAGISGGRLTGRLLLCIWGGTTFHFMDAIKHPRWEDFNIERMQEASGNRFVYLGDGFTRSESRSGSIGRTQTVDFDGFWDLFVLPDVHD